MWLVNANYITKNYFNHHIHYIILETLCSNLIIQISHAEKTYKASISHLPDSQARCSRGRRPSLAESVLSSTYWGREDDLDIEYSLFFQPNANLMLAHCLRHWLNINPTLLHETSGEMWWELSVILPVKFSATRHVLLNAGQAS